MSQEKSMTFRLNTDLRREFMATAEKMNMPAAQILRVLMQNFILRNQQASTNVISETEQEKRGEAVAFAAASIALEGYCVPDSEKQHAQRFISGEIDLEAFVHRPS